MNSMDNLVYEPIFRKSVLFLFVWIKKQEIFGKNGRILVKILTFWLKKAIIFIKKFTREVFYVWCDLEGLQVQVRNRKIEYCQRWTLDFESEEYDLRYFKNHEDLPVVVSKDEKGLTFIGDYMKCVYIRDGLDVESRLKTLVHEAGHVALNKKDVALTHEEREERVRKFVERAYKKKDPFCTLFKLFYKNIIPSILLICLFFSAGLFLGSNCFKKANQPNSDYVYITVKGEKYHSENCGTIEDSNKVKIPKNEAKKAYTKCKLCNPK